MALKHEGYPVDVFEEWSKKGAKYHEGECLGKWNSFREETGTPVTGATITELAKARGWKAERDDTPIPYNAILTDDMAIVDPAYIEEETLREPPEEIWRPADDAINYIKALFKPDEYVGFSFHSFQDKDGKWKPIEYGDNHRTAGEIVENLKKYKRVDMAISSVDHKEAGAWVRFNPLDGQGAKNLNVTAFRYTLVESDKMPIGKQLAFIKTLQLPCAAIVYSGGKSVHAIVHVDADTLKEYQQRVEQLYEICKKNGFEVDTQNKNPSRFSRFPGVMRGDHKQYLIATNTGQENFESWIEFMQDQADDLPPTEDLAAILKDPPPLAPPLIDGVLRTGHKMLLAGPSKAGKSFLLIELAIALSCGSSWLGFPCRQGRVLYVNLEIDKASCIHRFQDVYEALGIGTQYAGYIDILNLRGRGTPMDKLAPKLIRRAKDVQYEAIIIDPIYKVITGDENNASDMANFCNQFDLLCRDLGCSVIYCHHHSKGAQGNKKAMDRASGSGVFARDPDAFLDMTPLTTRDENEGGLPRSAFRIAGVLREFKPFKPVNLWFEYPIHKVDTDGFLQMAAEEGTLDAGRVLGNIVKTSAKDYRRGEIYNRITAALEDGKEITVAALADEFDCTVETVRTDIRAINEQYETTFRGSPRTGIIISV